MVPFAGYRLALQYPTGIVKEHRHTRAQAGLFDISHIGLAILTGQGAGRALETLTPADMTGLKPGRQRYALLLNDRGGIEDDIMVSRPAGGAEDQFFLAVNAAGKKRIFSEIVARLPSDAALHPLSGWAFLALQGPAAAAALRRHIPGVENMAFMQSVYVDFAGASALVCRSGYTGEDGFEVAVPASHALSLAQALLAAPEVLPAGLGARDSLRLEAGFCLYGQDIDASTDPVSAGLMWTVASHRFAARDFPGADAVLRLAADGPLVRRVGLRLDGALPARAGTDVADATGRRIGRITSGGFSPTLGVAIAMAYLETAFADSGQCVHPLVRGKALNAVVTDFPFVAHRTGTSQRRAS